MGTLSKYFYKLYIRITFALIVIIIFLAGFLYFNFKSYSLELLYKSDERQIQNAFENALQFNNYAKAFTTSLYQHPDATQLMMGDSDDIRSNLNSLRDLDGSITSSPFLYSVYLYNGQSDIVYMLGSNAISRKPEDFFDHEMVNLWNSRTSMPIARKIPLSENADAGSIEVFSYMLADFSTGANKPNSAIAVNVKVDWIFNRLLAYRGGDNNRSSVFMVLDSEGKAIAHSNRDRFLSDLSSEKYVQRVLDSRGGSGYFLTSVDGISSVVTFSRDSSSNWSMVSITPYSAIAGTVNKVKTITLLIGSIMLAICFILAFLLSRHIYLPIRNLGAAIANLADKQQHMEHKDEFSYISTAFAHTRDQLKTLDTFRKSHADTLKQKLLRTMLNRTHSPNFEKEFQEHNVKIDPLESIAVILFKIDYFADFSEQYSEADQVLLKFALMNIAEEIIQPVYKCSCVDMEFDHIVLLLNIEELPCDELTRLCRAIQASSQQYCSIGLSIFISSIANNVREVSLMYEECLQLSKYRLKLGHGCLLDTNRFVEEELQEIIIPHALLAKLTESLLKGHAEELRNSFQEIQALLETASYNSLMYNLSTMIALVFQAINTLERNSTVNLNLDFVSFDRKMKAKETLEEIVEELRELFDSIISKVNQTKGERSFLLVTNAQKYIRQHYKDKALSTSMVADHLELTASYLGKLFREHLSKSISDYITEVRLVEAVDLLSHTSLTVEEIVDRIGWENKKYFFTIFKKRYGATPTEFRLKIKIDTLEKE
ncbi:helix-turn-helix domain-containing protein [Paenibacillus sp. HB172176]|uniref:helix-turn-helix domain-containing protein n=1 Tax=Paenibacillus sp. HB172176 TaxID=2493690 RepID=UPI001439FA54|nr:helix-turn-helix domain-containing protein [Paenibacillus sp. HB172176]